MKLNELIMTMTMTTTTATTATTMIGIVIYDDSERDYDARFSFFPATQRQVMLDFTLQRLKLRCWVVPQASLKHTRRR